MFLDNIKQRIENTNFNLEKNWQQLWSQIGQKMINVVHKMSLQKKFKNKN